MNSSEVLADISSFPLFLWQLYCQYLWNYQPSSWVARIAYLFRVVAFLLILPIAILTLLDLTSYVIARTLGVIDDVKASTSDKLTPTQELSTPSILISTPSTTSVSEGNSSEDRRPPLDTYTLPPSYDTSHPQAYFASEEHNLKLSGVGVFSPATSRPPSPTINRRMLKLESGKGSTAVEGESSTQDDGIRQRKRVEGDVVE